MAEAPPIADDELLLRHIPGGTAWQAPGPRITSGNFNLRHDRGETGVSVTRRQTTTPERLLEFVGGSAAGGSRVAQVRAGDVRALGLRVVPKPRLDDLGHAEVQSDVASLDDHATRKKLAGRGCFASCRDRRLPLQDARAWREQEIGKCLQEGPWSAVEFHRHWLIAEVVTGGR